MIAELENYGDQLLSVRQDATGLMSGLTDTQFNWQPAPGRWSMAGCFEHLNLAAATLFIPRIDGAIADAKARGLKSDGPFAFSAFERWIVRTNDAPARMKLPAPKPVQPPASKPLAQVREEFVHWQDELSKRLVDADGLDLRAAKYKAPIPFLTFSLGTFIRLMLAHERRHTFQARLVRQEPGFPSQG